MTVLFSSMFAAISIVWEREFGFLKELLVAPIPRGAIVTAKLFAGSATATVEAGLMLALSPLAGARFSPLGALASLPLLALFGMSINALGIVVAARMKSFEGFGSVVNFVIQPIFFLSGALYPIDGLPHALRVVVLVNPMTYVVDAVRGLCIGRHTSRLPWTSPSRWWPRWPSARSRAAPSTRWRSEPCDYRRVDRPDRLMRWSLFVLLVATAPSHALAAPAAVAWQWDSAPDLFPRLDLTAGDHVLALKKKKLVLRGPSWSVAVAAGHEDSGATLAAEGGRVFVAFYNRSSAGCELAGFDGASGKQLWSVRLDGIGPIGHSKYSNRVQMRMIGATTVFGSEAKRYIEQRDAATGALVSHQLFAGEYQPDPISEWLFREVDLRLRKRPTYTVKVNDFLARHVMMKNADHAARGAAFAEAVRQLDRLGIFEIRLVDTGDDFDVIAKRLPSRRNG